MVHLNTRDANIYRRIGLPAWWAAASFCTRACKIAPMGLLYVSKKKVHDNLSQCKPQCVETFVVLACEFAMCELPIIVGTVGQRCTRWRALWVGVHNLKFPWSKSWPVSLAGRVEEHGSSPMRIISTDYWQRESPWVAGSSPVRVTSFSFFSFLLEVYVHLH